MPACDVCGRSSSYLITDEMTNEEVFICEDCMECDETSKYNQIRAKEMGLDSRFFPLELFSLECDCCNKPVSTQYTYHVGRRRVYCENCVTKKAERARAI